jgi:predicted Zn finger-like uncharacterized protein
VLTQCPNCQTTFRVTSEILRVAHGQVRCGRCQTQFDALERLVEEPETSEAPSGRFTRMPEPPPERMPSSIEVDEPSSHEEITLEGRRIEISGTYEVPGVADSDAGPQVRQHVIAQWAEVADDAEETSDPAPEDVPEYDLRDAALEGEVEADEDAEVEEPRPARPVHPLRRRKTDVQQPDELDLLTAKPTRARSPIVWKYLVAPLALLLALQIMDRYSAILARHPKIGPPLVALYDKLSLTITPDWNLRAYKIEHWPIISEPGESGLLRVRANITNLAPFPQPYPLLRLELSDRFGGQVRARDLEPAEYLDGAAAERLMAPSQKANVTFTIVDPGPDADGFVFDACLRGSERTVCAGEVPES